MPALVNFALDPDALSEQSSDLLALKMSHERLLRAWEQFGVLVHEGNRWEDSELHARIGRLPTGLKKLWQESILNNRRAPAGQLWGGIGVVATDADLGPPPDLDLVGVQDGRAQALGVGPEEKSKRVGRRGVEVCRFRYVDQADVFNAAREAASRSIRAGASTAAVWNERFAGLATVARSLRVVDRYALDDHRNRRDGRSGLRWLCEGLAGAGQLSSVVLFTVPPKGMPLPEADCYARQEMDAMVPKSIGAIHVWLINEHDAGQYAHDRYVRFDETVVQLGVGLRALAGPTTRVETSCHMKFGILDERDSEQRLRSVSHSIQVRPV